MTNEYAEWVSVVHICNSWWIWFISAGGGGGGLPPGPPPTLPWTPSPLRSSYAWPRVPGTVARVAIKPDFARPEAMWQQPQQRLIYESERWPWAQLTTNRGQGHAT